MYIDAIHYAAERLEFTELKNLQLELVVQAIASGGRDVLYQLVMAMLCLFFSCVRLKKQEDCYCGFTSSR